MTPYYQQDGITIYHGDCREVMPAFDGDAFDLLLTDPPYGVNWRSNRRQMSFTPIAGDDGTLNVIAAIGDALRCLRGRRHVYAFGRWDLSTLGIGGITELIWDKAAMSAGDVTSVWGISHEYITFGVKANAAQRRGGTGNIPARLRRGSVLRYQRPSGVAVSDHPTEKPLPLLRELIESSSRIGEIVLDPFSGCGSSLLAARLEGRVAVGVEIEEKYCEIAAKRLQQGALPMEMPA